MHLHKRGIRAGHAQATQLSAVVRLVAFGHRASDNIGVVAVCVDVQIGGASREPAQPI